MMRGRAALLGLVLLPASVMAGHGLLNSFSDLQWLPAAGRTPDQWQYRLDTWREQAALLLADGADAQIALCLDYMRDKLADTEAMVAKQDRVAAAVAITRYRAYLAHAVTLTQSADEAGSPALAERLGRALLEHQYMLSVDFPDLPPASRAPVAELIDEVGKVYTTVRGTLPRAIKESLFFKEEEVRWSWEMGKRAGEELP